MSTVRFIKLGAAEDSEHISISLPRICESCKCCWTLTVRDTPKNIPANIKILSSYSFANFWSEPTAVWSYLQVNNRDQFPFGLQKLIWSSRRTTRMSAALAHRPVDPRSAANDGMGRSLRRVSLSECSLSSPPGTAYWGLHRQAWVSFKPQLGPADRGDEDTGQ